MQTGNRLGRSSRTERAGLVAECHDSGNCREKRSPGTANSQQLTDLHRPEASAIRAF
jgi:hypothetical protein